MWQMKMAGRGEPWVTVGSFETVTAAAQKVIEPEGYPVSVVFFESLIETKAVNEEAAFGHLEHTGKCTNRSYVVKRVRH
jgi:hypothetical protein